MLRDRALLQQNTHLTGRLNDLAVFHDDAAGVASGEAEQTALHWST